MCADSTRPRTYRNPAGASIYNEVMVPRMFVPWANILLDAVSIDAGDRVVDVACGPGTVAYLAAARSGSSGYVLGCDLNQAMLDLAAQNAPHDSVARMEWRAAPAEALPAPTHSFDVVTCQQGLQFFANRAAGLSEMRRVLRSGGRLGAAVWSSIDQCPPFAAAAAAISDVLGLAAGDLYASGPWGWPDPDAIEDAVISAGFADVVVTTRAEPVTFDGGPPQFVHVLLPSAIGDEIRELDAIGLERLTAALTERFGQVLGSDAIESFLTSHIVTAYA